MKPILSVPAVFFAAIALGNSQARAYDLAAHAAITAQAIDTTSSSSGDTVIDRALKDVGLPDGARMQLRASDGEVRIAREWVAWGSKAEDSPDTRVLNHFHYPLVDDWDQAGLRVLGYSLGQSSALWQQDAQQASRPGAGPGNWSWPAARRRYLEAIASREKTTRENALADTLRALGQIVHLIQDASLPAHTRNDAHLYKTLLRWDIGTPDSYERFVDKLPAPDLKALVGRPPVRPAPAIFARPDDLPLASRTNQPAAPAPIKRLIDTGRYVGTNPDVLSSDRIGLAEYSHGNFFSDDTIFADRPDLLGAIPFPARTSVDLGPPEPAPGAGGRLRRYFIKVRHGDTGHRVAVPTALAEYLPVALQKRTAGIDGKVLDDSARRLLPRAVAYSAALLEYFFRGDFEADLDADRLVIVNRTAGEEIVGIFELYYDTKEDVRLPVGSWSVALLPNGSSGPLPVPRISEAVPPAEPESFYLVFRGRIGDEDGAVAARRVTREPISGVWSVVPFTHYLNGVRVDSPTLLSELPTLTGAGISEQAWYGRYPMGYSEAFQILVTVYRSLKDAPGETAMVQAWAGCVDGMDTVNAVDPRSMQVDIVEFRVPVDFEALQSLDYERKPPEIKRVLYSQQLSPFQAVPLPPLDIRGVRFFGIKAGRLPTEYPPEPAFYLSASACVAVGRVEAVR